MKLLIPLLLICLVLAGCTSCDEACYIAKAKYEEQVRISNEVSHKQAQENLDAKAKRELDLINSTGYQQKLQIELQERQTAALEKQAADVDYMSDSQKVKDGLAVASVVSSILFGSK